jgi:hypothetical protein
VVVKDRASGGMLPHKEPFAHEWTGEGDPPTTLEAAVRAIKPTTLVGVSAQGGAFTQPVTIPPPPPPPPPPAPPSGVIFVCIGNRGAGGGGALMH